MLDFIGPFPWAHCPGRIGRPGPFLGVKSMGLEAEESAFLQNQSQSYSRMDSQWGNQGTWTGTPYFKHWFEGGLSVQSAGDMIT
jgi:hypothetical protein